MESKTVRFGVFEVDFETGEVYKLGRPVQIQDQPYQILQVLLENPGKTVTRDEFRRRIWGDDVYVDFDRSLNTGVARLREALGDSSSNPVYIETVPRRGYRFVAPIGTETASIGGDDRGASSSKTPDNLERRRWAIALVAVGLLLVLAATSVDWDSPEDPEALGQLEPQRLTFLEGSESEPSFSPDGSQIAFTWDGPNQDNLDIYVKTVGADNPLALTRHPNRDFSPVWSPDGSWIAFLREEGSGLAGVYRIPPIGGREDRIGQVAFPLFRREGGTHVPDRHLSWTVDSEYLAVTDRKSPDDPFALYLLSTTTGRQSRLTHPPRGSIGDRNPAFSPDGRRLAFSGSRGDKVGVYLVPLAEDFSPSAEPEMLVEQTGMTRGLSWGRTARELVVVTERKLWLVDIERPRERTPVRIAGREVDFPAVSPTAGRLAYGETSGAANIWQIALEDGVARGQPSKVVSSTGYTVNFQLAPDGAHIAYVSFHPQVVGIWIADSNGANRARLGDRIGGTPRWSPDSSNVVFDSRSQGNDFDIWIIAADGGAPRQFTEGGDDDHSPSWSRDGKWIYFASDRGAGFQLWRKHVESGAEVQVTRDGGFYSEESVDGRFVYYTKGRQDWTVWRAPVGGGEEVPILESVSTWNNFAVAKEGIYYTPRRGPDEMAPIRFYDFDEKSVREVHAPERPTSNGISISSDGRRLLWAQMDQNGSDLFLVENFR